MRKLGMLLSALVALTVWGCAGGGGGSSGGNSGGGPQPGPATQLGLFTQPGGALENTAFTTQPRIEIRDAAGLRVTGDNTTVVTAAISLGSGTSGAVLGGSTTAMANAGLVTFSGLSIDLAGTAYTLTFTATGLTPAVSSAFNVTAPSAGGGQAPFVPAPPAGTADYYVSPTGNDGNAGTSPATAWRQLSRAAQTVAMGDIVDVADGSYARFTLDSVTGSAAQPVIFRATGTGAIINSGTSSSTAPDNRDAIKITYCSYIIIHGLRTANAYRAGCRVDYSPNVTVQGCVFANGGTWGCFTDYSDDCHLLGNECYGSQREHGIYHSNGGDRALIIGNYCHNNAAGGIQINADPQSIVGGGGTHEDGICEDCVIERNWCVDNGGGSAAVPGASPPVSGGGACLNFASIRDCDVRNNLLRTQYNQSGIVLWDDGNTQSGIGPGYGSMNNRVYHNTIIFSAAVTRHCFVLRNGSTGNNIRNNVCVGGARGIFEFDSGSLTGLTEDYNVVYKPSGWAFATNEETSASYATLTNWQTLTGQGQDDDTGQPLFTNAGADDYSLTATSPGRDDGVNVGITDTYDGASRPQGAGYDRGCFED